jgi:hypothetical protein
MKKTAKSGSARATKVAEMRAEYDFSDGVRGKYAGRTAKGAIMVTIDPDVAKAFPTSAAVNRALRAILDVVPRTAARRTRTKKTG